MSRVLYGPSDDVYVEIQVVDTVRVDRRAVTAGPQSRLYNVWRFEIRGQVAVDLPGYRRTAVDTFTSVGGGAAVNRPVVTDEVIREILSQPRLIFRHLDDAGNLLIRCPKDGDLTDAAFGPMPVGPPVIEQIVGRNHFQVRWTVDLAIEEGEAWQEDGSPVLLSHSWNIIEGIDERHHSTIHRSGKAEFDGNFLAQHLASPDEFRKYLICPCYPGYRRTDIRVELLEDGRTFQYQVTDTSVRIHIKEKGIVHVECITGYGQSLDDWLAGLAALALDTAQSAAGTLARVSQSLPSCRDHQPGTTSGRLERFGSGLQGGVTLVTGVLKFAMQFMQHWTPRQRWFLTVRVWGNNECTQDTLQRAAHRVVNYQMRNTLNIRRVTGWASVYDIAEVHNTSDGANFVEVNLNLSLSLLERVQRENISLNVELRPVSGPEAYTDILRSNLSATDHVHHEIFPFGTDRAPLPGGHVPAYDNGTRSKLITLVTQSLQPANQPPGGPKQRRAPRDLGNPNFEGTLRD